MFILQVDFVLRIKDNLMFLFFFELKLNSKEGTVIERIHLLIFIHFTCLCSLLQFNWKNVNWAIPEKKTDRGGQGWGEAPLNSLCGNFISLCSYLISIWNNLIWTCDNLISLWGNLIFCTVWGFIYKIGKYW